MRPHGWSSRRWLPEPAGSRNWACGERLRITKIWQAFRRSRDRINTARGSKIPQPLRPEKRLIDARLDLPVGLRRRSGVGYIPGSVVQKALHAERLAPQRPGGVASLASRLVASPLDMAVRRLVAEPRAVGAATRAGPPPAGSSSTQPHGAGRRRRAAELPRQAAARPAGELRRRIAFVMKVAKAIRLPSRDGRAYAEEKQPADHPSQVRCCPGSRWTSWSGTSAGGGHPGHRRRGRRGARHRYVDIDRPGDGRGVAQSALGLRPLASSRRRGRRRHAAAPPRRRHPGMRDAGVTVIDTKAVYYERRASRPSARGRGSVARRSWAGRAPLEGRERLPADRQDTPPPTRGFSASRSQCGPPATMAAVARAAARAFAEPGSFQNAPANA